MKIQKLDSEQQICSCVCYEAHHEDLQNDFMDEHDLFKAVCSFASRGHIELEHSGEPINSSIIRVLESYVTGTRKAVVNDTEIPEFAWYLVFQIDKSPEGKSLWQKIKRGELSGLSLGGRADRIEVV